MEFPHALGSYENLGDVSRGWISIVEFVDDGVYGDQDQRLFQNLLGAEAYHISPQIIQAGGPAGEKGGTLDRRKTLPGKPEHQNNNPPRTTSTSFGRRFVPVADGRRLEEGPAIRAAEDEKGRRVDGCAKFRQPDAEGEEDDEG